MDSINYKPLPKKARLTINKNLCIWNPFTIRSQDEKVRTLINNSQEVTVRYSTTPNSNLPHSYDDIILYSLVELAKRHETDHLIFKNASHLAKCINSYHYKKRIIDSLDRLSKLHIDFRKWCKITKKNKSSYNRPEYLRRSFHILSYYAYEKGYGKILIAFDDIFLDLMKPKAGTFATVNLKVLQSLSNSTRRLFTFLMAFPSITNWNLMLFMERLGFNLHSRNSTHPKKIHDLIYKYEEEVSSKTNFYFRFNITPGSTMKVRIKSRRISMKLYEKISNT